MITRKVILKRNVTIDKFIVQTISDLFLFKFVKSVLIKTEDDIVKEIESGEKYYTKRNWFRFTKVEVYTVKKRKHIRTVSNNLKHDNLSSLPINDKI
jgi:hypothetical protein